MSKCQKWSLWNVLWYLGGEGLSAYQRTSFCCIIILNSIICSAPQYLLQKHICAPTARCMSRLKGWLGAGWPGWGIGSSEQHPEHKHSPSDPLCSMHDEWGRWQAALSTSRCWRASRAVFLEQPDESHIERHLCHSGHTQLLLAYRERKEMVSRFLDPPISSHFDFQLKPMISFHTLKNEA